MQALKLDLAEKKVNAHRSRSTAYHAAAQNNAQDLLTSARTAAAANGRVSTAAVSPLTGIGVQRAGHALPTSASTYQW